MQARNITIAGSSRVCKPRPTCWFIDKEDLVVWMRLSLTSCRVDTVYTSGGRRREPIDYSGGEEPAASITAYLPAPGGVRVAAGISCPTVQLHCVLCTPGSRATQLVRDAEPSPPPAVFTEALLYCSEFCCQVARAAAGPGPALRLPRPHPSLRLLLRHGVPLHLARLRGSGSLPTALAA